FRARRYVTRRAYIFDSDLQAVQAGEKRAVAKDQFSLVDGEGALWIARAIAPDGGPLAGKTLSGGHDPFRGYGHCLRLVDGWIGSGDLAHDDRMMTSGKGTRRFVPYLRLHHLMTT